MGIGPNEKVRIGIIGCGGIANGKHMPSLKRLKNIEMVAFCDIIESAPLPLRKNTARPMPLFTPTIRNCWPTPPSTSFTF